MCMHIPTSEENAVAAITLDVLPLNGDHIRVLHAVSGLECVVAPGEDGWLQITAEVSEKGTSTTLQTVAARLAPVAVQAFLREPVAATA